MADPDRFPLEGGCDCRRVRYRLESAPLFVHCCHCRWCQRESGASFALNAMIEAGRVTLLGEEPELIDTPSESGQGQLARPVVTRIGPFRRTRFRSASAIPARAFLPLPD